MIPFKCPKCSLNSFSAMKPRCFHCGFDESTEMEISYNFFPTHVEISVSRNSNVENRSKQDLVPNDLQTGSMIIVQNGKRNESMREMFTGNNQDHEQCRQEICEMGDDVLSPYCNPGSRNYFMSKKSAARIDSASDISHSIDIPHKYLQVDKSQTQFHGMQELGNSSKEDHLTVSKVITSNINIHQNSQKTLTDSKISSRDVLHSIDNILAVPSSSRFSRNESLANLGDEKLQNETPLVLRNKRTLTINNILAVPSSRFSGNESLVNFGDEKLQNETPLVLRNKRILICRVCNVAIDKHIDILKRKKFYYCCICRYATSEKSTLQDHSHIHCSKKVCNTCTKEYMEGNPHEKEHSCYLCKKIFPCKTLLDQHSVDHKEYFSTHCWICSRNFNDHLIMRKGRKLYKCDCGLKFHKMASLKLHHDIHQPKLFCMICREEYPVEENNLHDRESKCTVCKKKFQCRIFLEEHFADHQKIFRRCDTCNRTLNDHVYNVEEKEFFLCCRCKRNFPNIHELGKHLNLPYGLRLFKCDLCGKRFSQKGDQEFHSQICVPLPFKCKICRARFPCKKSLYTHHFDKHSHSNLEKNPD